MSRFKKAILILTGLLLFFLAGCSDLNTPEPPVDEAAFTAELNTELARIMACYQKALVSDDPASIGELNTVLEDFDARYGSQVAEEFQAFLQTKPAASRLTDPLVNYPPLTNLPINKDGDVYLSGGQNSLASYLVDWVAPNVTEAHLNHGAILDLDKFDPTNLDAACFHTAVEKGAGYETAMEWMTKQNIAVMTPVSTLNQSALNNSQNAMDYYCNPNNTNMAYGFFENTFNLFNIVTKSDNYYWYCTKVVWRIYNALGIDIDSNSPAIDWSTSGLYSIVKAYYKVRYFWSTSKARNALNAYIADTVAKIVLSEEIYFSPRLSLIYQIIR